MLQNKNLRVYLLENSISSITNNPLKQRIHMEQQTEIRKPLTNNIQLRVTSRQKAFILLQASRKKLTPSTYLRLLINTKISEDAK